MFSKCSKCFKHNAKTSHQVHSSEWLWTLLTHIWHDYICQTLLVYHTWVLIILQSQRHWLPPKLCYAMLMFVKVHMCFLGNLYPFWNFRELTNKSLRWIFAFFLLMRFWPRSPWTRLASVCFCYKVVSNVFPLGLHWHGSYCFLCACSLRFKLTAGQL